MILAIYLFSIFTFTASGSTKIEAAKPEQTALLKEIDDKYQKADAISMNVDKSDKLAALDQTRDFSGSLVMKKGKFRIELQSKDKNKDTSLMVADGAHLWFVTPPPKEFKEAKTQVYKASMSDKRARTQGLLQILTEGGVLKYFKVTGVTADEKETTYFMQPQSTSMELRRLQVVANKKDKSIVLIKYWDSMDNETIYKFSDIDFKKPIKDELLSYTPPKDADVMNY